MKFLYIIILLCCNLSFLCATIIPSDSVRDYLLEEESQYVDSLFALSASEPINTDSVCRANRIRQQTYAEIDYSYETRFYITQNPTFVHRIGRVLVICDNATYNALSKEIIRYAKDIHNAYGCAVIVYSLIGGTAQDIKEIIKDDYEQNASYLSGVVFVGDLDYASFYTPALQIGSNIIWEKEYFPCDYYFMDLDGVWSDSDSDGFYDMHSGNMAPEIFVGRICAMEGNNNIAYLRKYFDKNHAYWTGEQKINQRYSLSFTGHDWRDLIQFKTWIRQLYGKENAVNMQDDLFTKTNYINSITNDTYEFVQFACHSSVRFHHISPDYVYASELPSLNIQTLGYNLFCCKACNWAYGNTMCLGESYLYSLKSKTLTIVGSTKSGGMIEGMKTFYKHLGEGDCIGTAYRVWWKDCASVNVTPTKKKRWYYGMCILGDPLINLLYDNQCKESIDISSWEQTNSSNFQIYHAQDEIIASCVIPNDKTLELHANRICLKPGFYSPENTNLYISIDPCYDNEVLLQRNRRIIENTTDEITEDNFSNPTDIIVSPNPCSTFVTINGVTENKIKYKIYDMNGVLVNSGFNDGKNIDISMLPAGLYTLTIGNDDILLTGLKIIKL